MIISVVEQLKVHELEPLVIRSEQEGFKHLRRLVSEYVAGENTFSGEGEALYIVREQEQIIGVVGLNQDPFSDHSTGRIRRLYVHPDYRHLGIGKQLVQKVTSEAKKFYNILVLYTNSEQASQFYIQLAFKQEHGNPHRSHYKIL
ncbi:GNAT family N-acetyltransferase [Paenibacillus sp. PsM32]|uniref:GNAT family N-acetyltransferase n=1 Tax=Paenibacillus sp. PsM32 TaxID=3030536 RepID=UPI00263AAF4D|nr:GNAT family N-acetyltransferase [Paenibacillus sp. PsM32]MDN4617016.1 GNAT family N-acetyltransferase [Paenibacillus sp. PsM32]